MALLLHEAVLVTFLLASLYIDNHIKPGVAIARSHAHGLTKIKGL